MDNVIYSYTDENAIEDGVLVDVTPSNDPSVNTLRPKVLMSTALYERLKEVAIKRDVEVYQVTVPLIMDAALVVQAGHQKDPNEYLWTKGLEGNASGQDVWVAKNGMGGFTLMFPSDY